MFPVDTFEPFIETQPCRSKLRSRALPKSSAWLIFSQKSWRNLTRLHDVTLSTGDCLECRASHTAGGTVSSSVNWTCPRFVPILRGGRCHFVWFFGKTARVACSKRKSEHLSLLLANGAAVYKNADFDYD